MRKRTIFGSRVSKGVVEVIGPDTPLYRDKARSKVRINEVKFTLYFRRNGSQV